MVGMDELWPEIERYQSELDFFLSKIKNVRALDSGAMERFEAESQALARLLKDQPFIPKWVLWGMRSAIKSLRADAPYIRGDQCAMEELADRLEITFDLILLGEDHEDRRPGVPRIL